MGTETILGMSASPDLTLFRISPLSMGTETWIRPTAPEILFTFRISPLSMGTETISQLVYILYFGNSLGLVP